MKFTGKTDINAPLNATFGSFADFESFERHARRAGAEVQRIDDLVSPGPGMIWKVRAEVRGKPRKIEIELMDYDAPNALHFTATTTGYDAVIDVVLTPVTGRQTSASITVVVKPNTLAARLILQSARLTKGTLNKRFRKGLQKFGKNMEDRIQSA